MNNYSDFYYRVGDGLQLYARDYTDANGNTKDSTLTVLCLHGLSRNSADFAELADRLCDRYRVLVPDQRGRGLSQWDSDSSRYQPLTYVQDMWQLLDAQGIERVVVIGTSMGGLMGMLMAAQQPQRIAGLVINDVGPEVDPAGLARLMSYVGRDKVIRNWDDAVSYTRELNQVCFPFYGDEQWQAMARRLYRENEQGVPVVAYDPAIAAPIHSDQGNAVPPDLWPLFQTLQEVPLLLLRAELSDLLSETCFARMQEEVPAAMAVTVPGVGHAPMLDEPDAVDAIEEFLAACDLAATTE
ncbi:alpha/beta fold hydrolase [Pseudomaricurvus sp. HS19]|uniref:alpha/beta fold hydrolase n=1 Tax=Pseudomaricurvus sp. HS19 TaxID=2692626 RepID=UPI00136FB872|nr:alpha/beta hydrolase [Pseudomaricurvus sp. HS19]MYM64929.1 alpha/beta fold hydrolase [Pseudomaricurvus sp. HS19]